MCAITPAFARPATARAGCTALSKMKVWIAPAVQDWAGAMPVMITAAGIEAACGEVADKQKGDQWSPFCFWRMQGGTGLHVSTVEADLCVRPGCFGYAWYGGTGKPVPYESEGAIWSPLRCHRLLCYRETRGRGTCGGHISRPYKKNHTRKPEVVV